MGDFGGVIGEVNVVCMPVGMRYRVFHNCRASGIKVHTWRMLQRQSSPILKGEYLNFLIGTHGWDKTRFGEKERLSAIEINFRKQGRNLTRGQNVRGGLYC